MKASGFAKRGNLQLVRETLRAYPCEIYFLGASVSTQRKGWPDQFLRLATDWTGHAHIARKTCIGGVGLLYGLAHLHEDPASDYPRIALVEFSTGDLNFGLTPLDSLRPWLRELLARLLRSGAIPIIIHNWRADFDVVDKHGIREAYDEVAAEFGIAVIENHRWVQTLIDEGRLRSPEWFRDYCHTTDLGAAAYAEQILHCIASGKEPDLAVAAPKINLSNVCRAFSISDLPAVSNRPAREFVYSPTDQRFTVITLNSDEILTTRTIGELMGIAFISGPRSTWVNVFADSKRLRKIRTFDRNSYYERYLLCSCPATLTNQMLEVSCDSEWPDTSIATQPHADFPLPRQLPLVEIVGRNLNFC